MLKFKVDSRLNLRGLARKGHATVGYSAPYAIYVHENMEMKLRHRRRPSGLGAYWDARKGQGRNKFLEKPLRQTSGDKSLLNRIGRAYKRALDTLKGMVGGRGPTQAALVSGAELMLEESQKIVPYEYGTLYRSSFIHYTDKSGTKIIKAPGK